MNRKFLIRLVLLALLVGAVAWGLTRRGGFEVAAVETWVRSYGIWAPVLFAGIYAVATVLVLPGSVLTIAAGALFGPVLGTLYSLTGATLGATIAFLIARHLASDWVASRAGGRLKRLIDGIEAEGWRFVAFTRLVPLFPFNFLNYGLGLTRIRLSHYMLASAVCMLPGGLAYAYLGYVGRQAAAGDEALIQKILIAVGLLAAVAFLPRFVRRLRSRAQ